MLVLEREGGNLLLEIKPLVGWTVEGETPPVLAKVDWVVSAGGLTEVGEVGERRRGTRGLSASSSSQTRRSLSESPPPLSSNDLTLKPSLDLVACSMSCTPSVSPVSSKNGFLESGKSILSVSISTSSPN